MHHHAMIWIGFNIFVLLMLALDLYVFHRDEHAVSIKESLIWSVFWVILALVFNVGIYFFMGRDLALKFLAGYLLERSLSMDNLFVFLMIFSYFRIAPQYQHKILFWGIIGALVMRALFIFGGITLIHYFDWIIYVFGVFLIYTGFKLFSDEEKEIHPEKNIFIRFFKKFFPVTTNSENGKFFVKIDGKWFATPFFVVLIIIETSDVMFAIDSIPAILSITTDSFIVYTSNVFAILGLRALYFALEGLMRMFKYLNYGLGLILIFVGVKMMIQKWAEIPIGITLAVITVILCGSILISILKKNNNS